jgi:hypothetical protein
MVVRGGGGLLVANYMYTEVNQSGTKALLHHQTLT